MCTAVKGKMKRGYMLSQNRNKKIKLAATGLKCKQMFECLVLSSIIIRAFMLRVLKLRMSAISLLKMHHRQMFEYYCIKTAGD